MQTTNLVPSSRGREGSGSKIVRLRCSLYSVRKNKRYRKRNFHPMEARRRHEGFPIISSDHLSGPVRPPPLVAELSLSIIRFSFRFSISPCCSAGIICQVLISEQFSAAMLLSWQGETGNDPTSSSGVQKSWHLEPLCACGAVLRDVRAICCRFCAFTPPLFLLMAPFEPCNDVHFPQRTDRRANCQSRRSRSERPVPSLAW